MLQDEWKLIYEMYYRPLYLYALSLARNRDDAEDLLQETFVKAFLSYEGGGSIKYWLITVLRNEFYNVQRKRKREVLEELVEDSEQSSGEDILASFIEKEERRQLFLEIQKLPIQMREVLMESVYFHMADEDIGKLHGWTKENVRKIRSRAKQKLIEQMKEGK